MDKDLKFLPAGYICFNETGTILSINNTLVLWLGYSETELINKSVQLILTTSSRLIFNTHIQPRIILEGKASEVSINLLDNNGGHIPVIANFVFDKESENPRIAAVLIPGYQTKKFENELRKEKKLAEDALRNDTELTSMRQQLQLQSEKFDRQLTLRDIEIDNRKQFNKILSHDFQEPIRKIMVFTDILKRVNDVSDSRKSNEIAEKISSFAVRLRNLVVLVEEFVRLDDESLSANVDLNSVLEHAVARAIQERNFKDFELVHPGLPTIEGFPGQLRALFFHLIDNAIQFKAADVRLVIKITAVIVKENLYKSTEDKYNYQDHVKIIFADNGIGFDNLYANYVFQLLNKLKKNSDGLGFGLAICKRVAERHFGSIVADSKPGAGTSFTILLPVKYLN